MCIRIRVVDVCPHQVAWDPDSQTIIVRRTAHPPTALAEIRTILVTDLDAPPAPILLCHCAEPVPLPPMLAGVELAEVPVINPGRVANGA